MAMINYDRRHFIKTIGAASLAGIPSMKALSNPKEKIIWGNLLHLGYNMWEDWDAPGMERRSYRPYLRFDEKLWNDLLNRMAAKQLNMVVIDLGDGVQYKSHPELAIKDSWSLKKLKDELKKIRGLGLEPIPKLNFSSCHDAWLGEYSRCLSTEKYYKVCSDLIAEVVDIFDSPRFFHLGMDEEDAGNQKHYKYVVVRQFDLWWHDFLFLCGEVKKGGVRPWIWSDYLWHYPDRFFAKMPGDVVQSNWYYGTNFGKNKMVQAYNQLDKHGYDQIPTASNHSNDKNFGMTVDYCKKHVQPQHLLGFLQTPWRPTIEEFRRHHLNAIDQVGAAIASSQ